MTIRVDPRWLCPRGSPSLFRNNIDRNHHGRHLPTVRPPVRHVCTLNPLFARTMNDLGGIVTDFGELTTDHLGYGRAVCMAMVGDDTTRFHCDFADSQDIAFQFRDLRRDP